MPFWLIWHLSLVNKKILKILIELNFKKDVQFVGQEEVSK